MNIAIINQKRYGFILVYSRILIKMVTKEELMEGGFSYPRFCIEKKVWKIFKEHCEQNALNINTSIRKLVVRYAIYNKLIPNDYPEDLTIKMASEMIESDPHVLRMRKEYTQPRLETDPQVSRIQRPYIEKSK